MTRTMKLLAFFALLAAFAFAQAPVPGIDYPSPIPVPFIGYTTGVSNPSRCVPGLSPLFFNTQTTAFYGCTARNTWTSPSITGAISGTTGTFSGAVTGSSTFTGTSFLPATVGGSMAGSAARPWFKLYLGTAATNNFVITPASTSAARIVNMADPGGTASLAFLNSTAAQVLTTTTSVGDSTDQTKLLTVSLSGATTGTATTFALAQTAARTITFPNASITVPGTRSLNDGTTSTAANTLISSTTIIHSGSAPLVSTGSASPVTVATFSPAFTSSTSYVCTASPVGGTAAIAAGGIAVSQSSGTTVVFTGPASVSTVINYICVGN